jgi:predicted Zn-dependent peptidase
MVLAAAGKVDHDKLVRHVEAQFGRMNGGVGGRFETAKYVGGTRTSAKRFEQSHLLMAFAAPSYRSDEFYTGQVFSGLFGGGMSSRLFQEVRERLGLCYAIYSSCWALADTGLFGVHAATGPEMMGKLIDVVGQLLVRAATEKPTDAELARSKAQLKAGLLMGLESSSARAEQMARQLLLFDRLIDATELVERIENVTADDVRELAGKLVGGAPPAVAVVGAGRKAEAFAQMAERAARV